MTRLPFSAFRSFSRLFRDYTEDPESLAPFFNGDYRSDDDLRAACDRAASSLRNREGLVAAMQAQASHLGIADSSAPLLAKLANPRASVVVTGQQLGLFGGPLYTLYKTLSTIQLATRLETLTGQPVVPVFWLEGEDHDFEEVASAGFIEGDSAVRIGYAPEEESETAVGRHLITEAIGGTLDRLEASLPPTEFRDGIMDMLRAAYAPGRSMLQAFVDVQEALLGPGRIAYISPDDPDLKDLAAPLFEKEITDFASSSAALADVSAKLAGTWHAQVTTDPTNLFLHGDNRRTALDAKANGTFETRDGESFTRDALVDLLRADAGAFSPNVVMRPLMQDWLLPTAAYVAGPGEVAYFAQFKPLYEWADIPMPVIFPRASVTLLEGRIKRVLDKQDLDIPTFDARVDELFHELVLSRMETDLETAFKDASSPLHEAVNSIKPTVEAVDRSLVKAVEALRATMMKEWNQMKGRVLKAEKQQHDVLKGQLERASGSLFPSGIPQERYVSPIYFANKYGLEFFHSLPERLDLDTSSHQVLEI